MELITESGLQGSFEVFCKIIRALEHNQRYRVTCLGEPQLGKRGLYPTISKKGSYDQVKAMVDFIAYADGKNDLLDISNLIHVPVDVLIEIAEKLAANHLLSAGSEEHI